MQAKSSKLQQKQPDDPEVKAAVSISTTRPTPTGAETFAQFYNRSKDYWNQQAQTKTKETQINKETRKLGFDMANEFYKVWQGGNKHTDDDPADV